jgi:hypothetical protein
MDVRFKLLVALYKGSTLPLKPELSAALAEIPFPSDDPEIKAYIEGRLYRRQSYLNRRALGTKENPAEEPSPFAGLLCVDHKAYQRKLNLNSHKSFGNTFLLIFRRCLDYIEQLDTSQTELRGGLVNLIFWGMLHSIIRSIILVADKPFESASERQTVDACRASDIRAIEGQKQRNATLEDRRRFYHLLDTEECFKSYRGCLNAILFSSKSTMSKTVRAPRVQTAPAKASHGSIHKGKKRKNTASTSEATAGGRWPPFGVGQGGGSYVSAGAPVQAYAAGGARPPFSAGQGPGSYVSAVVPAQAYAAGGAWPSFSAGQGPGSYVSAVVPAQAYAAGGAWPPFSAGQGPWLYVSATAPVQAYAAGGARPPFSAGQGPGSYVSAGAPAQTYAAGWGWPPFGVVQGPGPYVSATAPTQAYAAAGGWSLSGEMTGYGSGCSASQLAAHTVHPVFGMCAQVHQPKAGHLSGSFEAVAAAAAGTGTGAYPMPGPDLAAVLPLTLTSTFEFVPPTSPPTPACKKRRLEPVLV